MKIIHTPLTSHRIGKIKYHNALTQVHCFVLVFFLDHSRINGGCDEEGNLSKVGTLMDLWLAPFQAKTCNSQIPSISYPLLKRKKKHPNHLFSPYILMDCLPVAPTWLVFWNPLLSLPKLYKVWRLFAEHRDGSYFHAPLFQSLYDNPWNGILRWWLKRIIFLGFFKCRPCHV